MLKRSPSFFLQISWASVWHDKKEKKLLQNVGLFFILSMMFYPVSMKMAPFPQNHPMWSTFGKKKQFESNLPNLSEKAIHP